MSDIRQEIMRLQGDLLVTAGAGAGKTTCLVDTYLALISGDWAGEPLEPDQIVAITFTEKAADEMRARVVAQVGLRAAQPEPGGRDWAQVLSQVEWAPISTIHSFCASLLREFGAALGLDPDFAVLDAEDFDQLCQESADRLLRELLAQGSPLLSCLLSEFPLGGRNGLRSIIINLYGNLSTMGLSPEVAKKTTRKAHEQALQNASSLVSDLATTIEELRGLRQSELAAGKAKYLANLDELLAQGPAWLRGLERDPADGEILAGMSGLLGGGWGKVNSQRQILAGLVEELRGLGAIPRALELSQDLLDLTREFAGRLEKELLIRSSLSFDHLLNFSLKLLQTKPGILAEARSRWRVVLVDEFQDVNPVQGQLVELLASGPDDIPEGQKGTAPRILLVGDRKQSVYAFRGADVSVFNRTMQEFPQTGGKVLALEENFRSRPDLVEFFNRLFQETFSTDESQEKAPGAFVRFLAEDEQKAGKEWAPDEEPCVEVLRLEPDENLSLESLRAQEAAALANHLGSLLDSGKYQPDHMVILLRKLSQVSIYEQALDEAGLAFYTVRGRGFYASQEVADMLAALKLLLDPGDALSLAAFLRSPMIGLSDEALFSLVFREDGRISLDQALRREVSLPDWLPASQQRRWAKARRIVKELSPLARYLSPAELISRVLEETLFIPVLLGTKGGEQKAANLRKLLESSRGDQLGQQVETFVESLQELVDSPPQEPQAALLGESAGVIRIMTIHQAKGLQFKVTVLADLAGKPGGGQGGVVPEPGPNGLFSLKYLDPSLGEKRGNPVYKNLKEYHQARETAESARLFYVACTRAQERLVFCLSGPPKQNTWSQWVGKHVLDDPVVDLVQADTSGTNADLTSLLDKWPKSKPPDAGPLQEQGRALVLNNMGPRKIPDGANLLLKASVSSLEDFFTCPRRYFFTGILGLDTALLPAAAGQGGGGVSLGSQVHKLLEIVDFWSDGPEDSLARALETMGLEPERGKEAREVAARFWETGLPQAIKRLDPDHVQRERAFRLLIAPQAEHPGLVMKGELDLLLPHPQDQSRLLVVDYKVTGRISAEKYRDQLGLYALALWLAGEMKNPIPACALCFLDPEGSNLQYLEFTEQQLLDYHGALQEAAQSIAAAYPSPSLEDFPPVGHCPKHCQLRTAGFCPDPDTVS